MIEHNLLEGKNLEGKVKIKNLFLGILTIHLIQLIINIYLFIKIAWPTLFERFNKIV